MTFLTSPGKTYSIYSAAGCTVSADGSVVVTVDPGKQIAFVAPDEEIVVSDADAIIVEVTGIGADLTVADAGSGGPIDLTGVALLEGDNIFTASNTFAGSVDMSGASVTPPSGWNVEGQGLTPEQIELLTTYASTEGRNIPISEDGEIVTQIGHTYTITAGEQAVKCTDADFNPLCEVAAHKQMGFVAPATAAYVDNVTCTVTEVFRAAAPIMLSGNGSGVDASGLPAGYTRVEYLEGTGTQYIELNLQANQGQKVSGTFYVPREGGETKLLFGSRSGWQMSALALTFHSAPEQGTAGTSIGGYAQFGSEAILFDSTRFLDKKVNISIGQSGALVDEEKVAVFNNATFQSNRNYCIFTIYTGDVIDPRILNGRCYGFRIVQDGQTVIQLIPAVDISGAPCMYDIVSRTAFHNQGTGDFIYPTESTTYSLRRYVPEYAKLTEHGVRRLYKVPDGLDLSIETYAGAAGFKRIVEPERPEDGYWTPQWHETDDEIVLEWVETEPPASDETNLTNN